MKWALLFMCACNAVDAREAHVASVISRADIAVIRARPALAAEKYALMASSLVAFMRGSVALYVADAYEAKLGESAIGAVPVLSLGDAHPENFGLLAASDGTLALEANDFDAADVYPASFDLRRLTSGLVLAVRKNALQIDPARVARAAAQGYVAELERARDGLPAERFTSAEPAALADLFRRGQNDLASRDELDQLTVVEDGVRRLLRGAPDEDEPTARLEDLPPDDVRALAVTLADVRSRLLAAPSELTVKDAARQYGSGVSSWPRTRVLVLLDNDVIVEVKELADTFTRGTLWPGGFFDDVPARIETISRAAWARPDADPLWGASTWRGLPVQVRTESEGHKNLRIERLVDKEGSDVSLEGTANALGRIVARLHAVPFIQPDPASAILAQVPDVPTFTLDEANAALTYATAIEDDWHAFRAARERLGPLLGVVIDPEDTQ